MADQVITDYSRHPDSNSRNNNHMYWAAWGVMAAGIALDNPYYYEWAMMKYKQGANEIQDNGVLQRELERQTKAFNYHMFAIAPLVMMAETAARNGDDLYGYNDGALHRLVTLVINDSQNGQALITELSGKKQNMTRSITTTSLAWAAPYYSRFPEGRPDALLQKYSPLSSSRLGGNLSRLYQ